LVCLEVSFRAIIENVGLTNAQVTGYGNVGGLVGLTMTAWWKRATPPNCGNGGGSGVGGLVGFNLDGTVESSHVTGTVTGTSGAIGVGGLVGDTTGVPWKRAIPRQRSAVLNLSRSGGGQYWFAHNELRHRVVTGGSTSYYIGGLVGENGGTVEASYATGR